MIHLRETYYVIFEIDMSPYDIHTILKYDVCGKNRPLNFLYIKYDVRKIFRQ